jgi:hypothetical protein
MARRSAEGGLPNDLFQHLNDIIVEIGMVAQSRTAGV